MSSTSSVPPPVARSCDTAVALGTATADGAVILAKNSDRAAHEAQRLIGQPAAEHVAGSSLPCQYISVPQVAHTMALIGSQPYWLWGFEHGLNEHGVAIGNEAIHTREAPQQTGLLGMDLVRLGLERGTTAGEALQVITALLEEFGQGGSAAHRGHVYYDNSFLIADPCEAWVLETAGRRWVVRHLTEGVYAISNRPTIGTTYDLASPDLVAYAEERGWWKRGQRPFDFAAAYTDPDDAGLAGATCRLTRSWQHLRAGAQRALTTADMMALLRDHGPAPAGDAAWLAWPRGDEAATVCMPGQQEYGSTAASMVAHLVPGARPTYWASMAPPCTGIFMPCWVDTAPPGALAQAEETSPWWRYRRLWEAVAARPEPAAAVGRIRAIWRPLEEQIRGAVAELGGDAPAAVRQGVSEMAVTAALRLLAQAEEAARRGPTEPTVAAASSPRTA
jgi:dipeptidase